MSDTKVPYEVRYRSEYGAGPGIFLMGPRMTADSFTKLCAGLVPAAGKRALAKARRQRQGIGIGDVHEALVALLCKDHGFVRMTMGGRYFQLDGGFVFLDEPYAAAGAEQICRELLGDSLGEAMVRHNRSVGLAMEGDDGDLEEV